MKNKTKLVNAIGICLVLIAGFVSTTTNKKKQDTIIETVKESVRDSVIKDLIKDTAKVQVITSKFDYAINTETFDTIIINKPCIILIKKDNEVK